MMRSMRVGMCLGMLPVALLSVGCSQSAGDKAVTVTSAAPQGYKIYGGKMDPSIPLVTSEKFFAKVDDYNGKTIRISGTAAAVCEHRGCWLTIKEGERTLRARFVESGECTNGFFVPRDAGGHRLILQGTVKKETLTEARARHFLEDANAPQSEIEKIIGPQESLAIICTAVAIEGGDKLSEPVKAGGES